jgi:hypothetical protein
MEVLSVTRHRASLLLLASLASCGVALVASCTFPDVMFAPAGEAGSGSEGGVGEGSVDSSPGADASSDTAITEAATRPEASTKVDAAGCTSCDCDMDGYFARDGGCDGGPGPVYDCDDTDDFISPKQGFVQDFTWTSSYSVVYDWNCNGVVERDYPINLKCGGTVLTGCTGGQGYKGAGPNCGNSDDYFECKAVNGFCAAAKIDSRIQNCK